MRPRRVLPTIKGVVTDVRTGEQLFGISVQIDGTSMGAKTNFDGEYIIISIPPGTYDLLFTAVGYEPTTVTGVVVKANATTECNVKMNMAMIDCGNSVSVTIPEVEIKLRDVGIQKPDRTEQSIQFAPVATVDDLLVRETGFTVDQEGRIHVRGGRAGAFTYQRGRTRYSQKPSVSSRPSEPRVPVQTGFPPAHGGTAIVNGEPFDAMFFKNYGVNPFVDTEDDHLSTFAIDVDTGAGGLRFTVLPDRGLDISLASYKGNNLSFLTPAGETHPAFYEPGGLGWLRTFTGGLLTT